MKMKQFLSVILALCMVLSMLPMSTLAADKEPQLVDGYYEIYNADQLYWFAEQVNGGNTTINGKMMADIVVNKDVLTVEGTLANGSFRAWTPIGTQKPGNYVHGVGAYAGSFEGNGKTVAGLYVNNTSQGYVGLFGHVHSNGKVQNVGVVDSYIKGDDYVGGVAGCNDGTISNCYNSGNVSGNKYDGFTAPAGGVIGTNRGTVLDCYNTGNVNGSDYAGGVVGSNYGTISNCYNTGSVGGTVHVGGVVGYNGRGTISNSYNAGLVVVSSYVDYADYAGGVVGYNSRGTISNSYNTGDVSGIKNVGGVIGRNYYGGVTDCYNTGSTSGAENVGGVAGSNDGTISNSYNAGSVSGDLDIVSLNIGGVVGYNGLYNGSFSKVFSCYNTGSISGYMDVGGVVGYNSISSYVYNSYNIASVTGVLRIGGVVGDNASCKDVSDCYNTGGVSGDYYVGGVAGRNNEKNAVSNCYYRSNCAKDLLSKIQFGVGCEFYGKNVRDTAGVTIEKNVDAFASGEVCVLLQGERSQQFWGQLIGTDPSPVLGGEIVYVDNGNYFNKPAESCEHSYVTVVTAPTCTADGYTTYTCSRCGESYRDDVVAALDHSWEDVTCTKPMHCTVCGLVQGEALGHSFGEVTVYKPAPGVDGYSEHICTVCGLTEKFDFVKFSGVVVSGNVTSFLEGDVTVELLQDGEVAYSITVSSEYAIEGVVAGDYTLRISKANHAPMEFAITVGDEAVTQDATLCPIGDVTGDGVVNIKDFQRLLRHVNKTNPLEDYELACGDVTGDGVCNIKDFQRLLRHVNKTNPLF